MKNERVPEPKSNLIYKQLVNENATKKFHICLHYTLSKCKYTYMYICIYRDVCMH